MLVARGTTDLHVGVGGVSAERRSGRQGKIRGSNCTNNKKIQRARVNAWVMTFCRIEPRLTRTGRRGAELQSVRWHVCQIGHKGWTRVITTRAPKIHV